MTGKPKISHESEFVSYLGRLRVWRLLYAFEAGAITSQQGGEPLGLSANEFEWLRAVALLQARRLPNKQ